MLLSTGTVNSESIYASSRRYRVSTFSCSAHTPHCAAATACCCATAIKVFASSGCTWGNNMNKSRSAKLSISQNKNA